MSVADDRGPYRPVDGLRSTRRASSGCASTGPTSATPSTTTMMARPDRRRSTPPAATKRSGPSCCPGPGTTSAAAFDIVARNAGGDEPRPRVGQHPAAAPVPGPPPHPAAAVGAGAGGVRGPGLGRRHRAAAGAGGRLRGRRRRRPASGSRSPSAGFTPDSGATWLLPRRVGEVRAREMLLLGRHARRGRGGRVGTGPPGRARRRARRGGRGARRPAGRRADRGPRADQVAAARRRRAADSSEHSRNEAFALELSSRSEDFREGLAAFREKRPPRFRADDGAPDRDRAPGRLDRRRRPTPRRASARPCGPGSTTHVPEAWRRGRPRAAGPRRSARCGPGPTTRPGTRCSARRAWSPRPGRSTYGGLGPDPGRGPGASRPSCAPFNLGRLNPLGLNLAAPALFAHGTEEQRLRFLPPIVRNEEVWCQLFSEPGAGFGPGVAGHPGRARRRRVGGHRPEGVDDLGPPGRLRRAAGPHRPRRAQAPRASPTS